MPTMFATTGSTGAAVGTADVAAPNLLTIAGHGLVDGQVVVTSAPTGAAVGVLVPGAPYYVAGAATDTFQLRPSPGAPVMVFAEAGTVIVDTAEAVNDAQGMRQALSGLIYKGRDASPDTGRIGARPGILRGASTAVASISGLTVTVLDMQCWINTAGSTVRGGYLTAVPTDTYSLAGADPALTRVDLIVAEVLDHAADGSNEVVPGRCRVVTGTPGSGAPAVPSGTLHVLTATVAAAASTATLTYPDIYTVAAGGVLPVPTVDDLPPAFLSAGMYADVAESEALYRCTGTVWEPVASTDSFGAMRQIARAVRDSNSSGFSTTETSINTVTATLVDGADYLITWSADVASSAAADVARVRIRENSGTGGTQLNLGHAYVPTPARDYGFYLEAEYTATSSGSKTFSATAQRVVGTGTLSCNANANEPHFLRIVQVG